MTGLCDRIEIALPYVPDITIIDNHLSRRIEHYKQNPPTEEDIKRDRTLKMLRDDPDSYYERVKNIIEEYKIVSKPIEKKAQSITEIGVKKKKTASHLKLENLAMDYLNIIGDYISIEVHPNKIKKKARCPTCGLFIEKIEADSSSGMLECSICGYETQSFVPVIKDITAVTTSNSGYEDRDNFIKKMERKQGKVHSQLPVDLLKKLDIAMAKRGFPDGEHFRNLPLNELGEKDGTSLKILIMMLSDINMSKLYNDVDYIAHIYWGWTLLDFSHLEQSLLKMYDDTQIVYISIKNKERTAALNTEVRLYLQLNSLGFRVSKTRFRFQESQESLEFHQTMYRAMCEKSGYPFYSIS